MIEDRTWRYCSFSVHTEPDIIEQCNGQIDREIARTPKGPVQGADCLLNIGDISELVSGNPWTFDQILARHALGTSEQKS